MQDFNFDDNSVVQVSGTAPTHQIPCCMCAGMIAPNAANMCANCLQNQVDVTEGIQKQITVFHCRSCERYLRNPQWVQAELESRELLALCLKKIGGLSKVKLTDASWIWTEPHAKRLKIKLTVQKEVLSGAILQQTFPVEFIIANQQCDTCQSHYSDNTWESVCQVRQKVDHKRTFYFLEQLILKHGVADNVMGIKELRDGLDFYYSGRSQAQHMLSFLRSVVPLREKMAKRLVSQDFNNNTCKYKHTIFVEIAPICKDDLVILPKSLSRKTGGACPLQLCVKVSNQVVTIDPRTMKVTEFLAMSYWKDNFPALMFSRQLIEFVVMDIEKTGVQTGKLQQANVTVARSADLGENDITFETVTHLGHLLNAGDLVLGYDLTRANLNDSRVEGMKAKDMPEMFLVRKTFAKRSRNRKWKLKELTKERDEGMLDRKDDLKREQRDRLRFLEEIEEDEEMRGKINLYRDHAVMTDNETDIDEDAPTVDVDELLEGFANL